MSRTQAFFKNVVATGLASIVTMVSGFILPRIMLTVYGSEINGLITSITQFVTYFSLVEAGIGAATIYSLYSPLANHDTNKINSIITASKNFYFKTGYIFLCLISGGALVYAVFIRTNVLSSFEVGTLFFIIGFNSVVDYFALAKYRTLLTADQKTYVISLANIVQTVLNCSIIAIMSYLKFSVVVVRLVALSAILLRSLILWIYCKKKYSYICFNVEPDNTALNKRWDALYLQILGAIHTGAPAVIATIFLSLTQVSIYSIYNVVMQGINSILSIFTSGLSAGFGDLISRNDKVAFEKAFRQFEFIYYILITVVYSVTFAMYMPFIELYTTGADISYSYPIIASLMVINGFFYNLKTPYGMIVISEGKYKETRLATTIQGLLEIVCGSIGAVLCGIEGILIGCIISNLYRVIQFFTYAEGNLIPFGIRETIKMVIINSLLFCSLSFIFTVCIKSIEIKNALDWMFASGVSMFLVLLLVLGINYLTNKKLFFLSILRIKSILVR